MKPSFQTVQSKSLNTANIIQKPGNKHDSNRRKILVTILALLAGNRIYALKKNKMPDNQKDLLINEKENPVAPPGAGTIERFNQI